MRFVSAVIRPVGQCYQLEIVHAYWSGQWPTVTVHTSLDDAVTALLISRCGTDISFETADGQKTDSYMEYLALSVPQECPREVARGPTREDVFGVPGAVVVPAPAIKMISVGVER